MAGKSRNIVSNGSFWLILYLFSIHQINMHMPSTAAPKPCPTLVQTVGPKIWTIFRQKWLKKNPYPFGRYAYNVGSFDLSKTSPFFSGGAYIKWNGPMASNCIRHSLESVQEIKD